MIYSSASPAEVSEKCYNDIEKSLEVWYNSEHNPFRHLFENSRRVTQKYVANKLNLVIMDFDEDFLMVQLQGRENEDFQPYHRVFHKYYGDLE